MNNIFKETEEKIIVDLSGYKTNGRVYHIQVSDVIYTKKVSDRWEDLYVKTKFLVAISGKWIDTWHRIGSRMYK